MQVELPEPVPEKQGIEIASGTKMHVPQPNPFNPRVTLSYSLAVPSRVNLRVYDVRGRLVKTMVAGSRSAGEHSLVWDGIDDHGRKVASGVYFAKFESGAVTQIHRMVLLK